MQPACRSGHKAKLFKKYGAPLGRQLCIHAAFVSCAKDGIEDRKEYPEEYYMIGKVSWSVFNWYEVRFEVLRSRVSSLSCGAQDILWQNFGKLVVVGIKGLPETHWPWVFLLIYQDEAYRPESRGEHISLGLGGGSSCTVSFVLLSCHRFYL